MSFVADSSAPNGVRAECDRCGADCGNGGIDQCAIISDLDPDNPGMILNYHLCRKNDKQNACASKTLNATVFAWFRGKRDKDKDKPKSTSRSGNVKSRKTRSSG